MKNIYRIIIACGAILTAAACNGPAVPSDTDLFTAQEYPCVMVGKKLMLDAGPDAQYSYNPSKIIFRAGPPVVTEAPEGDFKVETVDQYYVLQLSALPKEGDAEVKGKLYLKAETLAKGFRTYDVNMAVIKSEDSRIWLWDSKLKVGTLVCTGPIENIN